MPYDYDEEMKRRKMMAMLACCNPTPELGNDSGGNNGIPMGQYVPGYPTNKPPKYYDGRMTMIKGGRRRKR